MASAPMSRRDFVVVDANVLIAICAREKDKFSNAKAAIKNYAHSGRTFYAPGLIVGEVLYVLCGKLQNGLLTATEHDQAVRSFGAQMNAILSPPGSDASLIIRAAEISSGYGCSRSADSVYLALAEELAKSGTTDLLTFDEDLQKQARRNIPSVHINLLPVVVI